MPRFLNPQERLRTIEANSRFLSGTWAILDMRHMLALFSLHMTSNPAATMGQRLREMRERAGLSLRDVAKAANVSAPFLSDVERGRRFPADETLTLIARKIRVSADELKKHDHRSSLAELKRLAEGSPSLGAAVRALVDQVQSGAITPDALAAKLRKVTGTK